MMGLHWLCIALALSSCLAATVGQEHSRHLTEQDAKPAKPVVPKKSNIIASAGEAELTNGIGDVLPGGACKADIKAFCKDVSPGEGRLVACLAARVKAQKKGNVAGRKVSDKCQADVASYKVDRSTNINKDIPLARACKEDVAKSCKDKSDAQEPGSVIACLREKKASLAPACKNEVFRTQQELAQDYRVDPVLLKTCKDEVEKLCKDVEAGEELECLTTKILQVSWPCAENVKKFEKQSGDDFRLSSRLFGKCLNDAKKFCKDVEPGHMRVQECLEDNSDKSGFSTGCKKELDAVIAKRVSNFKLDTALQTACEEDLTDICATNLKEMLDDERKKTSGLNCLQQYKEELKSEKCKSEVHRRTSRAARDFRFDDQLASSCTDDRAKYCNEVQPGSARVIRCLQEHRANLSQKCAAALFDHEVKMAEDIDFKYPMKKACAWEISNFCKSTPHGHARVIRCLEQNIEHTDMSKECKDEVMSDMNRMAKDYRLNWRLNHACESDIGKLCVGACQNNSPCGGVVLQCLQAKQENITSQACQEEVFYYELMEVTDFRNDVILAEACRADVDKYCKDTEPGEGRVHKCLRFHINFISERCRTEENKLQQVEYRDIRLRPKLNKVCSEEKAVYCKKTKPGKARVIKCLMENMAQPNFGDDCKSELQKREDAMKNDYRYDVGVFSNCASDVDKICSDAKTKLRGNATVLKCLADNFRETTDGCQNEMSRAVRFALWDYKAASGLTAVCDTDVVDYCPKGAGSRRSGGVFTIGVVGRCLSKSLVEGKPLQQKCRDLVLIAAPKDSRIYFDYPESTSDIVKQIANLQRKAGLEGTLVNPYARNGSTVTVTGWVALACMLSLAIVSIGGAVMVYRRFVGADKPHTVYTKVGDI